MTEVSARPIYIIGGLPRTGKTTLGERLAQKVKVNNLEIDHIRAMFDADPSSVIGYGSGTDIEVVTKALRPFIERLIGSLASSGSSLIINGEAMQPDMVRKSPHAAHIRACFLGLGDPERSFHAIREHARGNDWTIEKSDDELRHILEKYAARSAKIEDACVRLGIPYFDVSPDYEDAHAQAFATLMGSAAIESNIVMAGEVT